MLCAYGCKSESKYLLKNGKSCCEKHQSNCPAIKKKNSEGIKKSYLEGRKNIHYGGSKERGDELRKKSQESHLIKLKEKPFEEWGRKLKEDLIFEEQVGKCLICGIEKKWQNKPLTFELDHVDGNNKNNKRENLRLLCPNCHSQTHTWRGRNRNTGIKKVMDLEFLKAVSVAKNRSEALDKLNLSGGDNYRRAKNFEIINEENLVDFSNAIRLKSTFNFSESCEYSFYKKKIILTSEVINDIDGKALLMPNILQVIEWIKNKFYLSIHISETEFILLNDKKRLINCSFEKENYIIEIQNFLWCVYDYIRVEILGICG